MEYVTNTKLLLKIFVLLFVIAIVLSIVGERTINLFGGDRELATRVYKTLYMLLGGGMLVCVVPILMTGFVSIARRNFEANGISSGIAAWLLHPSALHVAAIVAGWLMVSFGVLTIIAAIAVWISGGRT